MGRTRRETLKIGRRRQQVAELYLKGWPQAEIARQLGVGQSTVSADLKSVRRQWRDSAVRDFDEAVAEEMAKLDHLEREAWNGWQRSLEPAEATRVTHQGNSKRAEKSVRQRQGDPRYLEQVQRCIASRRALLGLDAPAKILPSSSDGRGTYHAQVMIELMRLAEGTPPGPLVIDADYINKVIEEASINNDEAVP